MEITGGGFIAQNLRSIADRHPGTVAFAAGVSSTRCVAESEFARELALLRATIADCVRTGRRLLYFSTASAEIYGAPHCRGREDDVPAMRSPYGRHKAEIETFLRGIPELDFLVLRLAHLVGPNQPVHQLVPSLAHQVRMGDVGLHRGACRDLIDIADVVTVVDGLLSIGVSREIVNVATGIAVPIEHIVAYLEERLDVVATRRYVAVAGRYPISIDKLVRLLPRVGDLGFGATYYQQAIDSYLAASESGVPRGAIAQIRRSR
jgi:nucleoside-diphosphate-sugar epimerase